LRLHSALRCGPNTRRGSPPIHWMTLSDDTDASPRPGQIQENCFRKHRCLSKTRPNTGKLLWGPRSHSALPLLVAECFHSPRVNEVSSHAPPSISEKGVERSHLTDCIVSTKEDDQGTFTFIDKSQCAKVDPRAALDYPSEHGIAAIYLCCSLRHAAQPRWHLESLQALQHRPQRETSGPATARQQPHFPSIDTTSVEGCAKDSQSFSKLVGPTSLCRSSRCGAILFKSHMKADVLDCHRTTEFFLSESKRP
jgi:hypothetical protein